MPILEVCQLIMHCIAAQITKLAREITQFALWLKRLDRATEVLRWSSNDIGGILMEEHITLMAAQGEAQPAAPVSQKQR